MERAAKEKRMEKKSRTIFKRSYIVPSNEKNVTHAKYAAMLLIDVEDKVTSWKEYLEELYEENRVEYCSDPCLESGRDIENRRNC